VVGDGIGGGLGDGLGLGEGLGVGDGLGTGSSRGCSTKPWSGARSMHALGHCVPV
jgi:hypothetical protein